MAKPLPKKIFVRTSDDGCMRIDASVLLQSELLKRLIEDNTYNVYGEIPLPNVSAGILDLVIMYCKKHAEHQVRKADGDVSDASDDNNLADWDAYFMIMPTDTMIDLLLAAKYLEIPSLLDLACLSVAKLMMGRTPGQIRKEFNIKNDYTPEEEEQLRREVHWAFE